MNKIELADKIGEKVGIQRAQAEQVLNAFVDITIDFLSK